MLSLGCRKFICCCGFAILFVLAGCSSQTKTIKATPETAESVQGTGSHTFGTDNTSDTLIKTAIDAIDNGDIDRARDILLKAFRTDSTDWRAPYLLGRICTDRKLSERADQWFAYSLATAPNEPKIRALIYEAMGGNCEGQGEYGKARLHYMTALQLNPDSERARAALKRLELISKVTH